MSTARAEQGAQGGLRVAIMADETGWHTRRLQAALRRRGCAGRCVDLADCHVDTTASSDGLVIPGFERALPDAVIVRGLAGGTFEQVTRRLAFLHALADRGIPVYNDPRAIERSVDKAMTSTRIHAAGLPTPPTWATETEAVARRIVVREAALGHGLVLKPLFGSQGKGLQRVGWVDGQFVPLPSLRGAPFRQVAYLQRFIAHDASTGPGYDWRVLVIGGRAVAAMRRLSEHWIHNVAQGARCEAAPLTPALAQTAQRAAAALELDYAGVDLMPGLPSDEGAGAQPTVIEVNGVAAWQGLQRVTPFDIAQAIVDDLLQRRCALVLTPSSRDAERCTQAAA